MKDSSKNRNEVYARYDIPPIITMQIDTREQLPLLFPSTIRIPHPERMGKDLVIEIKTQRIKLPYGDYRLAEFPECCVIERKGSARELNTNLLSPIDAIRQAKAFRRLSTCEHPCLFIEASPNGLWTATKYIRDPQRLLASLTMVVAKYGFQLIWLPWIHKGPAGRREAGGILAHLMLAYGIQKTLDILPDLIYDISNED
ncbi:MAG TPA: hypothetical protein ENI27_05505 [bacterium]|nr:hypothetical protein [bacterium]